jgi:hypothetical protein
MMIMMITMVGARLLRLLLYSRVIPCALCLLTHSNGRVYCDSLDG